MEIGRREFCHYWVLILVFRRSIGWKNSEKKIYKYIYIYFFFFEIVLTWKDVRAPNLSWQALSKRFQLYSIYRL